MNEEIKQKRPPSPYFTWMEWCIDNAGLDASGCDKRPDATNAARAELLALCRKKDAYEAELFAIRASSSERIRSLEAALVEADSTLEAFGYSVDAGPRLILRAALVPDDLSSFPATKLDNPRRPGRGLIMKVTVNGMATLISGRGPEHDAISYEDVIAKCNPVNPPGVYPSVTFTNGPMHKPQGILSPGQSVAGRTGMQFTAVVTGSA
jgi:hypothetical protein